MSIGMSGSLLKIMSKDTTYLTCLQLKRVVQRVDRLLAICLEKYHGQQNFSWIEELKLTRTHYRRLTLFQEGLEIPCLVTVTISGSIQGHMLIQRYQQMVEELHCAPKEEVIMESFLEQIVPTEDEPRPKTKKKTSTTKKTEKPKGCKETFFKMLVDLAVIKTVQEQ